MNIVRTAFLLIVSLVIVPVLSYYFAMSLKDKSTEALTSS